MYVTRPAARVFDTPENRALAWILERLATEFERVQRRVSDESLEGARWPIEVSAMLASAQASRRHHWLRDIPAMRPDRATQGRLRAARSAFYSIDCLAVTEALRRYVEEPSPQDVTELLSARYFEPNRDWQLFEVVIALRLESAFRAVCRRRRKTRLLVGGGRGPFARFDVDGGEIRIWYQTWPPAAHESAHRSLRERYRITGSDVRPDIVIERVDASGTSSALLLEIKASRSSAYLSEGVFQLLGYLKDRPAPFNNQPSAWLVAPNSSAFESADPGGEEVWAIDSENVASAAVRHFALS